MGETEEKNINEEPQSMQEDATTPIKKKKGNFKLHIFLLAALGIGTWGFWTYSPLGFQLKDQWFPHAVQSVTTEQPPMISPTVAMEKEVQEISPQPVELMEAVEDNTSNTDQVKTNEGQTILETPTFTPSPNLNLALDPDLPAQAETTPIVQAESLDDINHAMQQLQLQVSSMQQALHHMQLQQLQQAQQQVRTQLFAVLRQASSPQSSLNEVSIAWKSISFMPLLSEDKRAYAEEAYLALQDLQQGIKNTSDEVSSLIHILAKQLQPKDLADVADSIDEPLISAENQDILHSGLNWFQQQFVITKVDQHAITISDDPYADLKQLMTNLHQLKQSINAREWDSITNLNTLFYQLEQRGLETNLTHETINRFKHTQQSWQNQAQVWMEQL